MKGHLKERSPGRWAIVLDHYDANGKRKRRWHSFQGTKREAQRECARLIIEAPTAVDPSRATVSEFLDRFERDWVALHTTAGSAQRYRGSLMHVRRHSVGGMKLQGVPKTKHGRRTISLPGHIVAELRVHWKEQQERRLQLGLGRSPDDATVLQTLDGKPLSPDGVSKRWKRAMPGCTLHSLRHTHASMLIASGMDILTISRRLGHANPSITLNTYGHLVHNADDRAAAIMDSAFGR